MREIRKRCSSRDLYELVAAAISHGARYRLTKAGIILYAPGGATVGTHFSRASDTRQLRNFRAGLRRAGLL